jgi:hypothetical protein
VAQLLEQCLAHVQQPTVVPLPESLRRLRSPQRTGRWPRVAAPLAAAATIAVVALGILLAGGGRRHDPNSGSPAGEISSPADDSASPAARDSSFARWNDGADDLIRDLQLDSAHLEQQAEQFWSDSPGRQNPTERSSSTNHPHAETQL